MDCFRQCLFHLSSLFSASKSLLLATVLEWNIMPRADRARNKLIKIMIIATLSQNNIKKGKAERYSNRIFCVGFETNSDFYFRNSINNITMINICVNILHLQNIRRITIKTWTGNTCRFI